MSNADQVKLSFHDESTFGAAGTGNYQTLRFTSESLHQETDTTESKEISPTREISDIIRTSIKTGGGIKFELSYGTYDDFLRRLFQSAAWAGANTVTASDISASSVDNSLNSAGSGFGSSFVVGNWVRISGFTGAGLTANAGYGKIVSATTAKIVLSHIILVTDAAGEAVTVKQGDQITNGATIDWMTIQKEWTDLTNIWAILTGQTVEGASLTVNADGIIEGEFSMMGKLEDSKAANTGSGYVAATTTTIMNAIDNVVAVYENGLSVAVNGFTFNFANNLRARKLVATLGASSIGSGKFKPSGTLDLYFEDHTLADKHIDFTPSSFATVMRDSAGNAYIWDFPRIKYTAAPRDTEGENTDVMVKAAWSAYKHATELITARLVRIAA